MGHKLEIVPEPEPGEPYPPKPEIRLEGSAYWEEGWENPLVKVPAMLVFFQCPFCGERGDVRTYDIAHGTVVLCETKNRKFLVISPWPSGSLKKV